MEIERVSRKNKYGDEKIKKKFVYVRKKMYLCRRKGFLCNVIIKRY
jgi:hypothetical protein